MGPYSQKYQGLLLNSEFILTYFSIADRKIRNEIEGKKLKLKKAKKEYERLRSDPNIQLYSTKPPTNY